MDRHAPHYRRWYGINQRCYNDSHRSYKWYGAVGVTNHWRYDFKGFQSYVNSLGVQPPGTTLDRIDGNLGYQPGNLQWSTSSQQNYNKKGHNYPVSGSGYRWVRKSGKWSTYRGSFTHKGKTYTVGHCANPADAYLQVLALRSFLKPNWQSG